MNDTTPEIAEKIREMCQEKTPAQRFKMGCSMYQTSRALVLRAILEKTPDISAAGLRQQLFLHFYRQDFSVPEQERVLAYLARK